MQVGVMITNGGPHPPDKWAAQTARSICDLIQIDEAADSAEAKTARKAKPHLELDLADVLEEMHRQNQDNERAKLGEEGDARLSKPLIQLQSDAVENGLAMVVAVTASTPFAAHFALPQVQAVVRNILAQHCANAMHIERSWHADRNPDGKHAKAFRARQLHGMKVA